VAQGTQGAGAPPRSRTTRGSRTWPSKPKPVRQRKAKGRKELIVPSERMREHGKSLDRKIANARAAGGVIRQELRKSQAGADRAWEKAEVASKAAGVSYIGCGKWKLISRSRRLRGEGGLAGWPAGWGVGGLALAGGLAGHAKRFSKQYVWQSAWPADRCHFVFALG